VSRSRQDRNRAQRRIDINRARPPRGLTADGATGTRRDAARQDVSGW
jgi:hypothetical protein